MSDPIPLAEEMTDNMALRHLVALTDLLLSELNQDYASVVGDESIAITDTLTTIRGEDLLAKKTIVINRGASAIELYESEVLIEILETNETWVSPLTGMGVITGKCSTGNSSIASVATYRGAEPAED